MTATTRTRSRTGSRPTTSDARRRSPTRRSATPTSSATAPSTDGQKTRRGNIRCRSAPISEHSCVARASNSTDRALLQLVEDIEAERAGKVAGSRARVVDFPDQGIQRQAARVGDRRKLVPERIFERYGGA